MRFDKPGPQIIVPSEHAAMVSMVTNDDFVSVHAEMCFKRWERTCSELGLNHKNVKPKEP